MILKMAFFDKVDYIEIETSTTMDACYPQTWRLPQCLCCYLLYSKESFTIPIPPTAWKHEQKCLFYQVDVADEYRETEILIDELVRLYVKPFEPSPNHVQLCESGMTQYIYLHAFDTILCISYISLNMKWKMTGFGGHLF